MASKTFPFVGDLLDAYVMANKDDDASPNYYGYVRADGGWYILKETISAGNDTYEYSKGVDDYATNWTGRAGLTYALFHLLTNLP